MQIKVVKVNNLHMMHSSKEGVTKTVSTKEFPFTA